MIVVSTGCPCGIGPEVSVAAAARLRGVRCVLVGSRHVLEKAASVVGVSPRKLKPFDPNAAALGVFVHDVGPNLSSKDHRAGKPTAASGHAQLEYVRIAHELVRPEPSRRVLVTGPVSKAAIASSGAPGASRFRGHTEYLEALDGADHSTMCFDGPRFATSLVTTHLPLQRVPRAITERGVHLATVDLAELLQRKGVRRPRIAVASLNPHAGESELLGKEETRAVVPGIEQARRALGRRAVVTGPVGAETAYRKAAAGDFDGVVAMYHDQATIPMKLVAFGDAVNVTMGLGYVRTSVDHGTAYDIAWKGKASPDGMLAAMRLARTLGGL